MTVIIDPREVYPNTVNSDEFGRVNGVTSPIQTQLNAKFAPTIAGLAQNDFLMRISAIWKNNSFSDTIRRLMDTKKYPMIYYDFLSGYGTSAAHVLTSTPFNVTLTGNPTVGGSGGIDDNTIVGNAVCYVGITANNAVYVHTSPILLYHQYFPAILSVGFYCANPPIAGRDATIRIGYLDVFTGGAIVDGLYFEGSNALTNWDCITMSGGGVTEVTDSGVAVSGIGSKATFTIITTTTTAVFYINGTPVATHTNLPSEATGIGVGIKRITAGGTQNILQVDRVFFYGEVNRN